MTQDDKARITGSVKRPASQRKDGCPICASYARLRGKRIRDEIQRSIAPADRYDTWVRFMAGVHARHLAPARTAAARATTSKETR